MDYISVPNYMPGNLSRLDILHLDRTINEVIDMEGRGQDVGESQKGHTFINKPITVSTLLLI